MSRAPCAPSTWPSALKSLGSRMATANDATWRPTSGISFATRPKNQTWQSGSRIVFAQDQGQHTGIPKLPSAVQHRVSDGPRHIHTTSHASESGASKQAVTQTSSRSSSPFNMSQLELDLMDADAFEPMYSPHTRRNIGDGMTTLSQADRDREAQRDARAKIAAAAAQAQDSDSAFEDAAPATPSEDSEGSEAASDSDTEVPDEPLIPVTHRIVESLRRQAAKLGSDNPASWWKYTLYADQEGKRAVVHYCTTADSIKRITDYFLNERVIGFDLEWNPFSKAGESPWWECVSVMQVASQSRIAVFHFSEAVKHKLADEQRRLHALDPTFSGPLHVDPPEIIPESLATLLSDVDILKTGVNIGGDSTRLATQCGIRCRGLFELSHLYKLVKHCRERTESKIDKRLVSMANQVQNILLLPLQKDKEVRTGQWSNKLNGEQILYAASDAYAGLQLFIELDERRRALVPRPPRPLSQEQNARIALPEGVEVKKRARVRVVPKPKDAENSDELVDEDALEAIAEFESAASATAGTTADSAIADRDALEQEASTWAEGWFEGTNAPAGAAKALSQIDVRRTHLRSYFLWHHKTLEINEIGKVLNIKPLTAANYIRSAIWMAKLPHDKARFEKIPNPMPFVKGRR